jgi:hypothetical protein
MNNEIDVNFVIELKDFMKDSISVSNDRVIAFNSIPIRKPFGIKLSFH